MTPYALDDEPPRFVIHLPVALADLGAARRFARQRCASLAHLSDVDAGQVTVSHEDGQHEHHRVFCDRPVPGEASCPREHGHLGACGTADD